MLQVILGVIRCISDFRKHCVSKTASLRSLCYPVSCGHCLPSCQAERQDPGLFVFVFVNMGPYESQNYGTSPTISIRFHPNFMTNMIVMGEYRLLLFLGDLKNIKSFIALWNFCQHRTVWSWKFQTATSSTVFIWFQSTFMRTLATMV